MSEEEEIKSGHMWKKEKKAWKEFNFALVGQNLHWFKPSKDKKRGRAKGTVNINKAYIKDVTGTEDSKPYTFSFHIVKSDQVLHLALNSEDDLISWMNVTKRAASGEKESKVEVAIQDELRKIGHEIDDKDLEFASGEDVIGAGASGIVRKGMWLKSTEVAVKALKNVPEFTDKNELVSFYKEIEVLSKLRHVNIVQMYGFCKKNNYLCLVTEFVRGGNLSECLKNKDKYFLDLALQIEIAQNITRGMVYLHNQNVIHRDLKPANILIENWIEGKLKVCDFGLSRVARKNEEKNEENPLGSPQYAAPELNTDDHTNKVDVFSFAIIMWELAFKQQPWPEVRFGWEFSDRYAKKIRPPMPQPSPFTSLIEKAWLHDPKQRPTFSEVYEDLEAVRKKNPTATLNNPDRAIATLNKSPVLRPHNSVANLQPQPKIEPGAEVNVTRAFSTRPSLEWNKFSSSLASALNTSPTILKQIEYIFNNGGTVSREIWDNFMQWFSPMAQPDLYQTSEENVNGGYDIETILQICSPLWFHGFLSSSDAQRGLKGKPDGTFLFRFSTTPGSYALSAAYSGTVGHWRISCNREPGNAPTFKIDGRDYKSLNEIINTHKFGKEPLKIKQPKDGQANSCFLGNPWSRERHVEEGNEYYQNVKK